MKERDQKKNVDEEKRGIIRMKEITRKCS